MTRKKLNFATKWRTICGMASWTEEWSKWSRELWGWGKGSRWANAVIAGKKGFKFRVKCDVEHKEGAGESSARGEWTQRDHGKEIHRDTARPLTTPRNSGLEQVNVTMALPSESHHQPVHWWRSNDGPAPASSVYTPLIYALMTPHGNSLRYTLCPLLLYWGSWSQWLPPVTAATTGVAPKVPHHSLVAHNTSTVSAPTRTMCSVANTTLPCCDSVPLPHDHATSWPSGCLLFRDCVF